MGTRFSHAIPGRFVLKGLLAGISLMLLAACGGGQPDLEPTQSVAQSPIPQVPDHATATIAWSAASGGNKLGSIQFEPVVNGNTVYTVTRSGHINGFDLDKGNNVFSRHLGEDIANGVGVNGSSIIAVTDDAGVVALDRQDASELWRYEVGHSISSAPALNDQVVVVRTVDGQVIGLNAATGRQIWQFEKPVASLSVGLDAPGLVVGEGVISGFSSGRVLASNIFNGTTFWEKRAFRPSGRNDIERLIDIDASPVLAGQNILVGSYQGGVVAYQMLDGQETWRNEGAKTRKPISISRNKLAVTGPESEVMLLDLGSGDTLWKKNQLRGNGLSAPVVADNSVVVGTMEGDLYFLDINDGSIMSRFGVSSGPVTSLQSVGQGLLVYFAGSGRLALVTGDF